jgi:hypothetical protein
VLAAPPFPVAVLLGFGQEAGLPGTGHAGLAARRRPLQSDRGVPQHLMLLTWSSVVIPTIRIVGVGEQRVYHLCSPSLSPNFVDDEHDAAIFVPKLSQPELAVRQSLADP